VAVEPTSFLALGLRLLIVIFGWLAPRHIWLPKLLIGRPQDLASEEYVCWWHVHVSLERRFWQLDRLFNCRIYLVIESNKTTQLLWRTPNAVEPEETVTLQVGDDPQIVPVMVRSVRLGQYWLCAAPVRLPQFRLDPFAALVTDVSVIRWHRNRIEIPTGQHRIQFTVQSGKDVLESKSFALEVPGQDQDNSHFSFKEDPMG